MICCERNPLLVCNYPLDEKYDESNPTVYWCQLCGRLILERRENGKVVKEERKTPFVIMNLITALGV